MIKINTDWFNPVFVKEIRQDFRSNRIQRATAILLALACLFSLTGVFSSALIMVMILMVFLTPGRLTRSLTSGEPGNCLELMSLTRLNSFKIVFGKWLAGITASLFYYFAALPFVAAYFILEKQNLYQSLNVVLLLAFASIAACSFATALGSIAENKGGSNGLLVFGIFIFFSSIGPLIGFGASGLTSGLVLGVADFIVLFIYLVFAVAICLFSGAASISSSYENYNPEKRISSFLAVVVSVLLLLLSFGDRHIVIVSSSVIIFAAGFFAIFEKRRSFVKTVSSISPLNWILTGGELQGIIWAFLLALMQSFTICLYAGSISMSECIAPAIVVFLTFAFPRAIQLQLPERFKHKFFAYLVIHLLLVILSVTIGHNFWSYSSKVNAFSGISPLMMFLYAVVDSRSMPGGYYLLALAQLLLTFALVAFRRGPKS